MLRLTGQLAHAPALLLLIIVALSVPRPTLAETCAAPTLDCRSVSDLLDEREGFGRMATGGLNGAFAVVTSPADDGPGSLRQALRTGDRPVWITFGSDMTITLLSQLEPSSDVTIDGRGHAVTLQDYGFGLYRQIRNIIITHVGVDGRFRTTSQALNVSGGVRDVWLDHLDLSRFIDRLVNVKRGSTDVTISWVKFHDHNKVMLLNNEIGDDIFADYERNAASRVTLHHNYFVNTVQRNPRAQFGTYQIYNNLLENWDFYGMSFGLEAKAVIQGNIFVNDGERSCVEPRGFATVEGVERNYCFGIKAAPSRAILPNGVADQKRYERTKDQFGYTQDFRAFLNVSHNLFLGASAASESYKPELAPSLPGCSSYREPDADLAEQIRRWAGNIAAPNSRPVCIGGAVDRQ